MWRAAATAAVVLAAGGWHLWNRSEPVPWHGPARVDGATVRLTYTGSECRDGVDVEVDEGPDRVTLTVRETVRAASCSDVGVSYEVTVELEAPLGERELLDGACGPEEDGRHAGCGS